MKLSEKFTIFLGIVLVGIFVIGTDELNKMLKNGAVYQTGYTVKLVVT